MAFSKRFDYRKRKEERDLFFGLPSVPFMLFLAFIAVLLIFNLIIVNNPLTGKVIGGLEVTYPTYEPGEKLVGDFALNFSQGDLIPKDSKIQILMTSPDCPLYYVCSDGSLSLWHSYDFECLELNNTPWLTCPDQDEFSDDCTDMDYTCCDIGYGQGLYYGNLECPTSKQCFDRCANISNGGIKNFTLEQLVLAYDSVLPYSGNFTSGDYNNANGNSPSGAGEGFAACSQTGGSGTTGGAIQNFPTGNAVQTPIEDGGQIPLEPNLAVINVLSNRNPVSILVKNVGSGTSSPTTAVLKREYTSAQPCPAFTAKAVYTCSEELAITTVPALAGGSTATITFDEISVVDGTQLTATVNPDGTAYELTLSDNSAVFPFSTTPTPLPADLIVTGIYYDYSTRQLSASVRNIGQTTAQNFYVQACKMVDITKPVAIDAISNTQTCQVLVAQGPYILNPGSQGRVIFGTYDLYGSTLKVKADSTNVVSESSEINNENSTYIQALSELTDIAVMGSSYDCGSRTITIRLTNNGANPTGTFGISLCTNYSEIIQYDLLTGYASAPNPNLRCVASLMDTVVESIEPGESVEVEMVDSTLILDGKSFTIDANPQRTILESNYDNNRLRTYVAFKPDFEVFNISYYSASDSLSFKIRNNGQAEGTGNYTVCQLTTVLSCRDQVMAGSVDFIPSSLITGNAIQPPGCSYISVCNNLPGYPKSIGTLAPGAYATYTVPYVEGKKLRITADPSNTVCETNENNNYQTWDYYGGTCTGNDDEYIQDPCSGTYDPIPLADSCENSTHLREYYCDNPECSMKLIYCRYGCNFSLGGCNAPTPGRCNDTDAGLSSSGTETSGINPLIKGTCTDAKGNSFIDYCATTGLIEYYCDSGECDNMTYPTGEIGCISCSNGACSENEYSCVGWNNQYSLKLESPPFNLVVPRLDLGYFILDISLVAPDGTVMSRTLDSFMTNDTSYRYCGEDSSGQPQCKRGYGINIVDECDSDSDCDEDSSGGGGGGDGGGCYEDWSCELWSSCSADGIRTRQCTRCSLTNTESEVCVYGCTEDWQCSEWTMCDESGLQTQICTDRNRCSARNSEYVEQRNCCVEDWDCKWGTCENGKQTKVCSDKNNCGTGFLRPQEETRECSGGFMDLGAVPLWVKIVIPVAIIGGVLASLFLIKRKPIGKILGSGSKSTVAKVAQTEPSKANYPELTNYIKTARGQGMNDSDIKKKLLDAGWPKDVIDSGMK